MKRTPKKKSSPKPPLCPNRIFLGPPGKCRIVIDGKELTSVTSIRIEQNFNSSPSIHLELDPQEVSIEAEEAEIIIDVDATKSIKPKKFKGKKSKFKKKRRKKQPELEDKGLELLDRFHRGDLDIHEFEDELESLYDDEEDDDLIDNPAFDDEHFDPNEDTNDDDIPF